MKATADHGRWWRTLPAQGSDRGFGALHLEIDPAMRSRRVVVLDELGEHALEMTLVSDEQPVEAFCARGANEPLCERVGTRRAERCLPTRAPIEEITSLKGPTNLASRSRIKNLTTRPSSSSVIASLRACWVTQLPIGCSVT